MELDMRLFMILENVDQLKAQLVNLLTKKCRQQPPPYEAYVKAGLEKQLVDLLIGIDPTPNKKYLKKIAQWFNEGQISPEDEAFRSVAQFSRQLNATINKVEDMPKITEVLEIFARYKDRFKNRGYSANLDDYRTFDEAMNAADEVKKVEGKLAKDLAGTDYSNVRGSIMIERRGPYTVFMTPKLSLAKKYGFTPEECIKFLENIGEHPESKWCTRKSYSSPRAEMYLTDDSVYTILKNNEPYVQCNFLHNINLKDIKDHEINMETMVCKEPSHRYQVDPEVKQLLLDVLSSKVTLKLDTTLPPEEQKKIKDDFYEKNDSNMAGVLKLASPKDLETTPGLNQAIKGYITHRRNITHMTMIHSYMLYIAQKMREATKDANNPAEALAAVKGSWLEMWANLLIKNPFFLVALNNFFMLSFFNDECTVKIMESDPWSLARYYFMKGKTSLDMLDDKHRRIIESDPKAMTVFTTGIKK